MKGFEERLNRLEELNEKISASELPLDEAISAFEEGIKLAKQLEKELQKVERKIEILTNQPEESGEDPHLELFPELGSDSE